MSKARIDDRDAIETLSQRALWLTDLLLRLEVGRGCQRSRLAPRTAMKEKHRAQLLANEITSIRQRLRRLGGRYERR